VPGRCRNSHLTRTALVVLSLICIQPIASAASGVYISDMPRQYPRAYNMWTNSLPYTLGLGDWLVKLNGVVSPIRDVTVQGTRLRFGTVCVPHDCGDNIAGILFAPQGERVMAVVQMVGHNGSPVVMVVGRVSDAEYVCIRRLVADDGLSTC
jgi:hypothetical protein